MGDMADSIEWFVEDWSAGLEMQDAAATGHWIQSDGSWVKITSMTDRHLENTIRILRYGSLKRSGHAEIWLPLLDAELSRRERQ